MDNHDIRFVTTSRGGENLIVDNNFKFRLHSTREDKRYWKCITKNCKAKAHTDNENGNRYGLASIFFIPMRSRVAPSFRSIQNVE